MTDQPTKEPSPVDDPAAAFQRLQKLTKALLGVDKAEYDRKRAEYDQGTKKRQDRTD